MEQTIPLDQLTASLKSQQEEEADFATIAAALTRAAEAGNAEACHRLGLLYLHGRGVETNPAEGARWLTRAAGQGLPDAQRMLAWLHANGFCVEQSDEETRRWYLTAAEAGDAKAQTIVGHMYQTGKYNMKKDVKRMLSWYQQAAAQQDANAEYALGRLLAEGTLLQQNDEAAFQWLSLAMFHGSDKAGEEFHKLTERLEPEQLAAFKERMMARIQGT